MNKIPMTSIRQDWRTPKAFYQALNAEFNFVYDPCPSNHKNDGLFLDWDGPAFINPPFKGIEKWVKKAYEESQLGKIMVMLIPSRTDTRWWHDYCMKADEIRFIKGRLQYGDCKKQAPFPSCIIVFMGKK